MIPFRYPHHHPKTYNRIAYGEGENPESIGSVAFFFLLCVTETRAGSTWRLD